MRTARLLYAAAAVPVAAYFVARTFLAYAAAWCRPLHLPCWLSDAALREWPAGLELVRRLVIVLHRVDVAFPALTVSVALAVAGFGLSYMAVDLSRASFAASGLSGTDLLKRETYIAQGQEPPRVPESMGLPVAAVYLFLLLLYIPFRYLGAYGYASAASAGALADGVNDEFAAFLSALLSMYSGVLLGFVDDVLDIRWRYKLPIPFLASIPMLVVYFVSGGSTTVIVPAWPPLLRDVLGSTSIELGALYYAYMMMLSVFCTNCINILAGINGVEVGQAIVIAVSVCINDLLYLNVKGVVSDALALNTVRVPLDAEQTSVFCGYHGSEALVKRHLFSLNMLLPFIGTSAGLLAWNKYPSRVFVGDTFCYFAGIVLAACGVLGHYSKTLLLFFLPQIFNFVLSCPQLFGTVPCPRHRVPAVDPTTLTLVPSCVRIEPSRGLQSALIRTLERVWVVQCVRSDDGVVVAVSNMTLLNALLVMRGVRVEPLATMKQVSPPGSSVTSATPIKTAPPLGSVRRGTDPTFRVQAASGAPRVSEHSLWRLAMLAQISGSLIAFGIRHWLASLVFPST